MTASAFPAPTQLSPAARARRERRALRRDPYGLHPTVTEVDGRATRSLSAGNIQDYSEVVLLAALGAPGYLAPWARETLQGTRVSMWIFLDGAPDMRRPAGRLHVGRA